MNTNTLEYTIEHIDTNPSPKPTIKKAASTPLMVRTIRFAFNSIGRVFPDKASEIALYFFSKPRIRAKHKFSDAIIESAKTSDILIDDISIRLYEWGEGDKTVVLAHGWESRGTALRAYIPNLLDAGFKVVAFDAPAHGDSGGKHASLVSFGEVLKTIIEQNGRIHGLIAHSFGGPACIYAMSQLPTRLTIPRVVMVACPSAISVPIQNAINFMNLPQSITSRFIKRLEDILQQPLEKATIPHFANSVNIKKMLIVHDIHDEAVPIDSAIANSKAFKQSQLLTTDGLGHSKILKDKQVIDRVTNFVIR